MICLGDTLAAGQCLYRSNVHVRILPPHHTNSSAVDPSPIRDICSPEGTRSTLPTVTFVYSPWFRFGIHYFRLRFGVPRERTFACAHRSNAGSTTKRSIKGASNNATPTSATHFRPVSLPMGSVASVCRLQAHTGRAGRGNVAVRTYWE